MKQAGNNEMDLLLRALARPGSLGTRGQAGPDNGEAFADHLDADELNAFAEGVVPEAARARYTEHLADCRSCRRIVVSLTQAAGTTTSATLKGETREGSFWRNIASWFSLPVLRYAVPALALAAVIGLGLLAFRQQRSTDFVAQHQPNSSDFRRRNKSKCAGARSVNHALSRNTSRRSPNGFPGQRKRLERRSR